MTKAPTNIPEQNVERAMQAANFGMDWMRQITEQSLNQSRAMLEGFLSTALRTADSFDQQASEVRHRSMTLATEALSNAFDFAQKASQAKDPQHLVQLQSEFISHQAQAVAEQSKLLGDSISRGANEIGKMTAQRVAEVSRRAPHAA
jgi:phasin family protein